MHPLSRAATFAFACAVLGSRAEVIPSGARPPAKGTSMVSEGGDPEAISAVCPPFSLPDGDACIAIPPAQNSGSSELAALPGAHHDKRGRFRTYDQIPRRPDRPAAYEAYLYPVPVPDNAEAVMSGYDLDLPESEQRRGRKLSHVGHGGIDIAAPRGTPAQVLALEHQEGDAEVLFIGQLFGTTVVTKHVLREGGRLREYIVLHGHLDAVAPGLEAGTSRLARGAVLGYVGDSGSEGVVHLHLEVRRVREGIDLAKTAPERLVANDVSVVCDPRNVLGRK